MTSTYLVNARDLGSFRARRGETLLDAALVNGIDLPHDCRSGTCGSCRCAVTAGAVEGGDADAQGAVLAPASGRVLTADVPAGSVVMPGQSIAKITAGPVVVRIELPEAEAQALKVGDVVQLTAEDLHGTVTQGVIAQIYPDVTAGQVTADVTAPGLPQDLVGQRVRAQIKIGQRQALVVPRRYIATRFGVDYVSIVRADGTASETPVQTTAGPSADQAEILSGLRAGDTLTPPVVR